MKTYVWKLAPPPISKPRKATLEVQDAAISIIAALDELKTSLLHQAFFGQL